MIRLIAFCLLGFCALGPLVGQRAEAQSEFLKSAKKVVRYKKSVDDMRTKAEAVLSGKAFDNTKFKEKKTGKVFKYGELTDFARKVIQITAIEKLTKELTGLYDEWKEDLDKLKIGVEEKRSEKDDDTANHADVVHYREQLLNLRKEVAGKYEAAAADFFDKYPEKFTKEETQGYLGRARGFHDAQKLVERKK